MLNMLVRDRKIVEPEQYTHRDRETEEEGETEKEKGNRAARRTGLGKNVWATLEMQEDDPDTHRPKREKSVKWWRGT